MKLFAPKNTANWNMADPESAWRYLGSTATVSGKCVSEESAKTFSAVFSATRIISEAVAALPCAVLEQIDYRTTRKATDHPLWRIVHDVPNPEQDKMTWFDMQTAFLPNWGNCYSEIQRQGGEIVALWPIHPSRLPLKNITRNPTEPYEWRTIQAGQPGEIVYWVKNDDNTTSPIPASDMLHVPGVLSSNGITGQSIVKWAANSIGIGLSTEEHAGAFFRNGAVPNIALKHPKILGPQAAKTLRESWQETFGGVKNHYKALILEEGMAAEILTMDPEASQLILSRQFGVSEIARWWKIPPHMLGDLSRSTFSNIEQQYLEFVVHSLGPWVVRWESAMYRQLLTRDEQQRYRCKFNLNGMLRGDTAARSAFYKSLFDMGVVSPNDIRELEDWNPIEGGDQRFIPGNNLIPLDKASEMADAQIAKLTAPPPAPAAPPTPDNTQNLIRDLTRLEMRPANGESVQEMGRIDAKIDKPADPGQAAVRKALALALKRSLDRLAEWESKALVKAAEKPREWVTWREGWYARFRTSFAADLSEFAPDFEACGIILEPSWGADRYAARSIADLKELDRFAADNYCDRVRECVDRFRKHDWAERTKFLAEEMMERGNRLFEERKLKNAS